MTDRIAEIEARLDRKREPCQDIYFDSWNWDQKKFHLHAEEDVAFLLSEVRRLQDLFVEDDGPWRLVACKKDRDEWRVKAQEAQSLALSLADALSDLLADTQHEHHYCGDDDCPVRVARAALVDERLAKLREMKNGN